MFGEDTNDWIGAKVSLYPSRVDFKGKTMPTIKVRRPQKAAAVEVICSSGHLHFLLRYPDNIKSAAARGRFWARVIVPGNDASPSLTAIWMCGDWRDSF
jgi:hypothetical protein